MKMSKERGFAILIILAVIATASVVLATQLSAVEHQQLMAIRAAEELKARDVAEGCLSAADSYIRDFGLADLGNDFDAILDPDDNIGTTDDNFLPPDDLLDGLLGVANIPPATNDQFHRYKVFQVGTVGACFVRFDDNSDDSNPLEVLDRFTDAGEGTGVDLPQRDRDRSMSVTVVGVVPLQSDLAELYRRAHAVASITVLRAMPPFITQGAAIQAGQLADLDGAICGNQGGVIADSIQGGVCVCGSLDAEGTLGTDVTQPPDSDCDDCDACAPTDGSNTAAGNRPDPNVEVPAFASFLANEGFGVPGSGGNILGDGASCKLFFRDDDAPGSSLPGGSGDLEVFLWDRFDANPQVTLVAKYGAANALAVPAENCGAIAPDPAPLPCSWTYFANPPAVRDTPSGLSCGVGQSGCWKLVARLGDTAGRPDFDSQDVGVARPELASTVGTGAEFMARTLIPNMADPTRGWADYCGGCTNCAAPQETVRIEAGDDIRVKDITTANFPSPAVLILNTRNPDAATNTTLFGAGAADVILDMGVAVGPKLTILTNGGVDMTSAGLGPKICCPTCNCPTLNAVGGNICAPDSANVVAMSADGFAIRAEGNCEFRGKANAIVGRVDCETIDSDNGDCFIGDLVAHQPDPPAAPFDCPMGGVPSTLFCDTSSAICFKNSANVRGNLFAHGNICSNNNLSLTGSIQSEGSIGWKNNGALNGQVIAEENVGAKNNNEIEWDGLGIDNAAQGIAASLWIDGMW